MGTYATWPENKWRTVRIIRIEKLDMEENNKGCFKKVPTGKILYHRNFKPDLNAHAKKKSTCLIWKYDDPCATQY